MDGVILQAIAVELDRKLAGSRLDRVVQVSAGSFLFKLWNGREKVNLLIKAEGDGACYETRIAHPAPAKPPRFCQLLRARLRRLHRIEAEPLDRIIHFIFTGPEQEEYHLHFEAVGGRANLILVDREGKIVDLAWRQDGERSLMPGSSYQLPEPVAHTSLINDPIAAASLLSKETDAPAILGSDIAPMSPALAQAIHIASKERSVESVVETVGQRFSEGTFVPLLVRWQGRKGLLPVDLATDAFDSTETFDDLSTMLEREQEQGESESTNDIGLRFAAVLKKHRKRLLKRLKNIEAEQERQAEPERWKMTGDLLLANIHRIKRGDASIEVDDYYRSPVETITIALETKLTPQENAERYFKLYRKANRSVEHHQRRQQETADEIEWLDQLQLSLEEAEDGDDLYQIQQEIEGAGLLTAVKGELGKRKQASPADRLMQTTTPAGRKICWGRNGRTNDYISRELTRADDWWFHAHHMPGCHLVMKCNGKPDEVSEAELLFAAAYAAGYSRGKGSGKVEVMVARGRDVKKPKGAKPGLVTVDSYRTLMVVPQRLEDGLD